MKTCDRQDHPRRNPGIPQISGLPRFGLVPTENADISDSDAISKIDAIEFESHFVNSGWIFANETIQ